MEKVEKQVHTNKELRETLESYNLNDDTIDLIEINLYLKKWATYEYGVSYVDLNYKGYNYKVHGFLVEKRNDPELFYYDEKDEEKAYDCISLFLEKIQDKEISVLEEFLDFRVNGETDSWWPINTLKGDCVSHHYPLNEHLKPVEWIDETPEEIKDEFEKKFRDNNYFDVVYDGEEEIDYAGGDWDFFDYTNNVSAIYFNINSKGTNYDIRWINKKNIST